MQHAARFTALRSLLRRTELPSLLVTDPANILYLTGVDASEGVLLVQRAGAILFLDGRYREAAMAFRTKGLRISDRRDFPREMARVRRCGYEEGHVTAGRLRRWKSQFKSTKFVHISGLLEGLRRKKEQSEIVRMKHALRITDAVLRAIPAMLKPGMTEKELAAHLLIECLRRGADGLAFDPIVAFGSATSEPHHRPDGRTLRRRDIVQIDLGARVKGYCSDRSDVFFVGEPTPEQKRVHAAVREAKDAAKNLVRPGTTCGELDAAARAVLRRHKLERYFPHALGHGLGLEIHEGPTIVRASDVALAAGDAITIEPGTYIPGKFGIRLEETLFVR